MPARGNDPCEQVKVQTELKRFCVRVQRQKFSLATISDSMLVKLPVAWSSKYVVVPCIPSGLVKDTNSGGLGSEWILSCWTDCAVEAPTARRKAVSALLFFSIVRKMKFGAWL